MILYPAGIVLVGFIAIITGWGPEFFCGCSLVAAIAAFQRRHGRWWGLAGAATGLAAGTGILVGWPFQDVWPTALVVFVVIALLRAVGHLPAVRSSLPGHAPSRRS